MIVTVTLNPAVDKTCTVECLTPGKVNRLQSVVNVAGGKGINVAKILRQFEVPVRCLGFLGGYSGKFIRDTMEQLGAECRFTAVSRDTRTNTNILGVDGVVTEVLEPGPVVSEAELQSLLTTFRESIQDCELVVLAGSLPAGVPQDIYGQLIHMCRENSVPVLLDTSGEALKWGIAAKPDWVKPNKEELIQYVGKNLTSREEIIHEAGQLLVGGIRGVVVSLGAEGLLYVGEEQALFGEAKKVKVVNTVGCGDSVVASLAMSIVSGDTPEDILKKAVCLSAANATTMASAEIPFAIYHALLCENS